MRAQNTPTVTLDFPAFAKLVVERFQDMTKSPQVYVADVDGDTLFKTYLEAFPAGTNPIRKKATEHDCTCCKHFIRRIGNVVTIDEQGAWRTVWDTAAQKAPYPYDVIAQTLRSAVLAKSISDLFRVGAKEHSFGVAQTRSLDAESGKALTWDHFYSGPIPQHLRVENPDQVRGDYRTTVQVFERGLRELTPEAVEMVLSLIEANNIYRGEEHKPALLAFQKAQRAYVDLAEQDERWRSAFVWTNAHGAAAKLRNSVIGTLVQDLSEVPHQQLAEFLRETARLRDEGGAELPRAVEQAVASFETKVAPANYKRPSAVITPMMVKRAMEGRPRGCCEGKWASVADHLNNVRRV